MQVQIEKRYYTPEEYCQLEETAEYKNEYLDGDIIPMTGATINHNLIAGNFYKNFPTKINNQDYWAFMSDVRLWMPRYRFYTYPDVMVIKDYYVEQFYQQNNGEWLFKASESDKDALRFHSVDFQMSLQDIYQRIDFNLSEE
ncbi:MAG: Uma2 family endonuclease [Microcystis aeruginosa K13-05]|nr:Uma2 family endonuclease [Microcystis aeruginosa K13-05]